MKLLHRIKNWSIAVIIASIVAGIAYGILWIDVLYARTFTPMLLEAVRKMGFIEALFSPKRVIHLWIAVHITESPLLTILYISMFFGLSLLIIAVKSK